MPPKRATKEATPTPTQTKEKKATWTDKYTEEEKTWAKAEAKRLTVERKAEGKEGTVSWLSVLSQMGKTKGETEGAPAATTKKVATECKGLKPKTVCEAVTGCKWKTMKSGTEYCAKVTSTTRAVSPGRAVRMPAGRVVSPGRAGPAGHTSQKQKAQEPDY